MSVFDGNSNWISQTLPFIEQATLGDILQEAIDKQDSMLLEQVIQTPVVAFYCPTRRVASSYPLSSQSTDMLPGPPPDTYGDSGGRTDYALNGGATKTRGDLENIISGIWQKPYGNSSSEDPFGRRMPLNQITDGTSETYLVGEKAMNTDHYESGQDQGDAWPYTAGHRGSSFRFAADIPKRDSVSQQGCKACHDFGSAHPSTWNAVFCDGSVRGIGYDIDFSVHQAMASSQGEEPTGLE